MAGVAVWDCTVLRLFYSTFAHAHKSSAPAITACTDERAEIVLDLETFLLDHTHNDVFSS